MTIESVDVFSCTGVLARGLQEGGVSILSGFELDPVRADHFRTNTGAPCVEGDVFDNLDQLAPYQGIDLATICPPCQGFSAAGKRDTDDPRNELLRRVSELVRILRPRWLLVENVPRAMYVGETQPVVSAIQDLGYSTVDGITQLADYGLPQLRQHWFLWGSLGGSPFLPPPRTHGQKKLSGQLELGVQPWVPCGTIVDRGLPGLDEKVFALWARRRHVPRRHMALLRRLYPTIEFQVRVKSWNGHRAFTTTIVHPDHDLLPRITGSSNRSGDCLILDGDRVRYPTLAEGKRAQDVPDDWSLGPTKQKSWEQIADAVPRRFGRAIAQSLAVVRAQGELLDVES